MHRVVPRIHSEDVSCSWIVKAGALQPRAAALKTVGTYLLEECYADRTNAELGAR